MVFLTGGNVFRTKTELILIICGVFFFALACNDDESSDVPDGSERDADALDTGPQTDAETDDSGKRDTGDNFDSGLRDSGMNDSDKLDSGRDSQGDLVDAVNDPDDGGETDSALNDGGEIERKPFYYNSESEIWEGCPTVDDFIGPSSGPATVHVTDEAIYCVLFQEDQTFTKALAAKALVRFAPGDYPLGTASGVNVMLPTCIRVIGDVQPQVSGAAPLAYEKSVIDGVDEHLFQWRAPVSDASDTRSMRIRLSSYVPTGEKPSIVLNGSENVFDSIKGTTHGLSLCPEQDGSCTSKGLDSCVYESATLHKHTISFSDGEVEFDLRIGETGSGTEPGAFTGASGMWKGTAFEQYDYFKLIYIPTHHHFERSFIVLFDVPIEGACGLRVSNIDTNTRRVGGAATVDCRLRDIEKVAITGYMYERR